VLIHTSISYYNNKFQVNFDHLIQLRMLEKTEEDYRKEKCRCQQLKSQVSSGME
jgi:hypothetical protein